VAAHYSVLSFLRWFRVVRAQSTQSAGPVHFLIFCSISIFLLASLVAGREPQYTAGAVQQGMYSIIPIHWNIKSAPASPGRSHVGTALYVFSLLGYEYLSQPVIRRGSVGRVIVYKNRLGKEREGPSIIKSLRIWPIVRMFLRDICWSVDPVRILIIQ
jgi:hypothetical protein